MASPIETPTWEKKVECGCKGCAVARSGERKKIANEMRELIHDNHLCWSIGSLKLLNDFIKELEDK